MYGTNQQYTPFGYGTVPPPDTTPPTKPQQSGPFPITWIVAATAIIAIGVAITLGVAIYRRKRLTSTKTS